MNMHRCGLAVAGSTLAVCAAAQSTVQLSGNVDLGVARTNGSWEMRPASSGRSNLSVSGSEDLGGGRKAFFLLHHRFNPNDGTVAYGGNNAASQPFYRHLWVGLAGAWGDVRLGRMLVPHQDFNGGYEPWGTSTVASIHTGGNPRSVRSNNTVYWRSPTLEGFQLHASISAADDQGHPAPTGDKPVGLGLRWQSGIWSIAAAWDRDAGDLRTTALYGKVDLGAATAMAQFERFGTNRLTDATSTRWSVGLLAPVGATTYKAGYRRIANDPGSAGGSDRVQHKFGLGLDHALSKRTFVYTDLAKQRGDGLDDDARKLMFDVGVSHKF